MLYWRQRLHVNGYLKVFVAGPLRGKPPSLAHHNYRHAVEVADKILNISLLRNPQNPVYAPFLPHLYMNWHVVFPHRESDWIMMTSRMMKVCDVAFRIDGPSEGTDNEVIQAAKDNQPMFSSNMCPTLDESIRLMDANLSGYCLIHATEEGKRESLCEDKKGMLSDQYDIVNCLDCRRRTDDLYLGKM